MYVTARSYLTAGIAALGVGAVALAPVQPIPSQITAAPERVVSNLAVELASTIDPITPWVTAFETAFANIQTLGKLNEQNPFPLLKTVGANIGTYFGELGNGNAGLIPEQIWGNIQTFFQAPWNPGEGIEIPYDAGPEFVAFGEYASSFSPPEGQRPSAVADFVLQANVGQWIAGCEKDDSCSFKPLIPITNFLDTPYSGQLVALVGALISPFVQVVSSFTAIGEYFQAGDVIGAINELINIPANMTNASLNGAGFLDLTGIVNAIVPDSPLTRVGVNLGGLLNVMPQNGGQNTSGDFEPPTEWSGGVGIDSLVIGEPGDFDYAPGIPNGLLGANIGLGQFLADKLLITPPPVPTTAATAPAADDEEFKADLGQPSDDKFKADLGQPSDDEEFKADLGQPSDDEEFKADLGQPTDDKFKADLGQPTDDEEFKADLGQPDDSGDTGSRRGDSRGGASDAE